MEIQLYIPLDKYYILHYHVGLYYEKINLFLGLVIGDDENN